MPGKNRDELIAQFPQNAAVQAIVGKYVRIFTSICRKIPGKSRMSWMHSFTKMRLCKLPLEIRSHFHGDLPENTGKKQGELAAQFP